MNKQRFPLLMLLRQRRTDIKGLIETPTVSNAIQQAQTLGLIPEGSFQPTYTFPDISGLSNEYSRQMKRMLESQTADQYTGYLIGRYANNLQQLARADLQQQQQQNLTNIHLFALQCKAKLSAKELELEQVEEQLKHVQNQLNQLLKEEEQ